MDYLCGTTMASQTSAKSPQEVLGKLLTVHKMNHAVRSAPILYIIKSPGLTANVQVKGMVCNLVPCHKMLLFWQLSPFWTGQSRPRWEQRHRSGNVGT